MTEKNESYEERLEQFSKIGIPPRNVPPILALSLILNKACIVGAVITSIWMFFVWIFLNPIGMLQDLSLNLKGAKTEGVVVTCQPTGYRVSKSHGEVFRIDFKFETPKGKYDGFSFTTGHFQKSKGDKVTVEYLKDNPETSRIKGTRKESMGFISYIFILLPISGLITIAKGIGKGLKTVELLKDGVLTFAEVLDFKVLSGRRKAKAEVVLKYTDDRGIQHTKTLQTENIADMENKSMEPVLYNPANPDKIILTSEFSRKLDIGNNGELREVSPVAVIIALGAMILLIGPHIAYFVYQYVMRIK